MVATGRGMQKAKHLVEGVSLDGPMVLVNGAEVWAGPGELLERHYIKKESIKDLCEVAEKANARFWGYSVESLTKSNDWTDDMYDRKWMKFGIRKDDLEGIKEIREHAKQLPDKEITRSASVNMEVSRKGISKASGVKAVCDHLNITMDDVIAIGDNLNDAQLIEAAGLGIAVENADPEL